jgi:hypothetical protein
MYYLKGELNDECIDCKMEKGLAPGQQTGFGVWAEEVKVTRVNVVDDLLRDVGEVPVVLLRESQGSGTGRGAATDVSGIENREDDYAARLRVAFAPEQGVQSSSTVEGSHMRHSTNRSDMFERQLFPHTIAGDETGVGFESNTRVYEEEPFSIADGTMDVRQRDRRKAPAKRFIDGEDTDDWMWGGMKGFEDEAS